MSEDMLKTECMDSISRRETSHSGLLSRGGFTFGSAYELPSQEGAQLARYHHAVSVTVNHRLNALGFLDLLACFTAHPSSRAAAISPSPNCLANFPGR
jgi:para-nitrobenzyl esterase